MQTAIVRVVGFLISLVLSIVTYCIIMNPAFFQLTNAAAVYTILILAGIQAIVQFIFFLDVWREKAPFWNSNFFAGTISCIVLIVFFTIWIMNTLNSRMM
jgi:cytochrome o ubiquinol oxidase subunit IV